MFLVISSFLLLLGVVKLAYSVWWKPKQLQKQLVQQGIRGSPYRLLLGDLKELGNSMKEAWSKPMNLNHEILSRVIPFDHKTVQKYGKMSFSWLGTTPRVIIQDPELVKEVFSNLHIQKPPIPQVMKPLGMGLTSLEGEEWVQRRRLLNPAFHLEKLKGMVSAISDSCVELMKRWEELMSSQGSCELDVWPEFQSFTLDVISKTAFSSNYNEGKKIFDLQKELIQLVNESISTSLIPGYRFLPTRKNRRMGYLDKEIKKALTDLINKRQAAMRRGESSRDDLLGLMLQPSENEQGKAGLSIQQVTEECKTLYIAAQETTASLLTWTLIGLSMNPRWQEEARKEVLQVCGEDTPVYESINDLKILSMILNEVLRLYPPVIAVYRHMYQPTKVGEYISIPGGVDLVLPALLIHHDPELWGEDAEEFKPDRFSGGVSKASKTRNTFVPFGAGPKTCIGQNFAMIEAKMALATILQHFSFELSPSYTHAPYTVITLQPQHGAQLVLRKL